jgi:hypothetical protein
MCSRSRRHQFFNVVINHGSGAYCTRRPLLKKGAGGGVPIFAKNHPGSSPAQLSPYRRASHEGFLRGWGRDNPKMARYRISSELEWVEMFDHETGSTIVCATREIMRDLLVTNRLEVEQLSAASLAHRHD